MMFYKSFVALMLLMRCFSQDQQQSLLSFIEVPHEVLYDKVLYDQEDNASLSVAFSHDGDYLAAGINEEDLLWNLQTGARNITFNGYNNYVTSVKFSPDDQILAIGLGNGTVKLWNRLTDNSTLFDTKDYVECVGFSSDGRSLASALAGGELTLWNLANSTYTNFSYNPSGSMLTVDFSSDGKYLASGSVHNVTMWDLDTDEIKPLEQNHSGLAFAWKVKFSPDSKQVAAGFDEGKTILWNVTTGKPIYTWETDAVRSIAFSSKGDVLASGLFTGKIKLWDTRTGDCIKTLDVGDDQDIVTSLAFSPDDKQLASGSDSLKLSNFTSLSNGLVSLKLRLWDLRSLSDFRKKLRDDDFTSQERASLISKQGFTGSQKNKLKSMGFNIQ